MNRTRVWLIALAGLLSMVLVVAACGPQMASPTPKTAAVASPTAVAAKTPAAGQTPSAAKPTAAAAATVDTGKLPVDAEDWHALGPADAAVTVIEYSDFQ
jgi:protein-disulfide isomerase